MMRLNEWARAIKRDVHALWLAAHDPRTPWHAKAFAFAVAAYAPLHLDLIPDFIPVLGYLDELTLLRLGILLAIRLVPAEIMAEHRATAAASAEKPVNRGGAIFIVALWVMSAASVIWWATPGSAR